MLSYFSLFLIEKLHIHMLFSHIASFEERFSISSGDYYISVHRKFSHSFPHLHTILFCVCNIVYTESFPIINNLVVSDLMFYKTK
jgi:hypothetical protein